VNRVDRFGLGWRSPIAEGILANLDRIDVLEVVAEDWIARPRREWTALRRLARQAPVHVHGVSLGAASSVPVALARLDRLARLVGYVEPEAWSEHLAFVRGGGFEIGHLAAPPRDAATLEGAARNFERSRAIVGRRPLVENVATLIDPPGSECDEATWTSDVVAATGCDLLLDLHNLHANARNFGFDSQVFLDRIPIDRVGTIHIAGGRLVGRVLDDHLHEVPDAVFALLSHVAARTPRALTVILERDGAFHGVSPLLAELDLARAAVAEGRAARVVAGV
jgi:uncharacterized protein (UPF0276 family)